MSDSYSEAPCNATINDRSTVRSVYDDARREAEKYKWIESEKNGCDLGPQAIEQWYEQFWGKYCRARRLEHLAGEQKWLEFAEHEFGRMFALLLSGNQVLEDLLDRFEQGWENLDFSEWVHDEGKSRDQIAEIIELLEIININIARLDRRQHP